MFVGACWHHIYGVKGMMINDIFRQYAEAFHLRINTDGYFLPARYPSHIMGNRVPLGCDLDFEFIIIHHARSIHFA